MKYTTVLTTAVFLAGHAVQPAEASIGTGAGLLGDFIKKILELVGVEWKRDNSGLYTPYIEARQGPPAGVPEFEYQRCSDDITGLSIGVQGDGSYLQFTGVPATCMNLANVLIGDGTDGPYALPCGSDCLSYSDLTPEQYDQLTSVLRE